MTTRFGQNRAAGGAQLGAAPMGAKKGRFAGVDLTLGLGKPLLPDGTHTVEIGETKRSTMKGDTFFAECTIIDSNREDIHPGSTYQWMRSLKDSWGYGVADVCRFAIACGNLDDAGIAELQREVDEGVSVVDAASGIAVEKYGVQPLTGCKVRVHVSREGVKPSKDGRIYPNCTFEAIPE